MTIILSGTNGVSDVDGSASTPAIRGTDTNTGIFFPAADTIAFAEGGAEVARFDSSGNLLVGVTSGAGRIRMKQSADAHTGTFVIENFGNTNTWSFLIGSDNNLYFGYNTTSRGFFNNSTGAYTAISDLNLKKNVEDINYGLSSVLSLRPVSYQMNDQEDSAQRSLGFIAQEALEVVPESVSQMSNEFYGMDKESLVPVLVKAIQEQQAIITDLKARIETLENK